MLIVNRALLIVRSRMCRGSGERRRVRIWPPVTFIVVVDLIVVVDV